MITRAIDIWCDAIPKLTSDKVGSHEGHGEFVRVLVGTLPERVVGLDFWGKLECFVRSVDISLKLTMLQKCSMDLSSSLLE